LQCQLPAHQQLKLMLCAELKPMCQNQHCSLHCVGSSSSTSLTLCWWQALLASGAVVAIPPRLTHTEALPALATATALVHAHLHTAQPASSSMRGQCGLAVRKCAHHRQGASTAAAHPHFLPGLGVLILVSRPSHSHHSLRSTVRIKGSSMYLLLLKWNSSPFTQHPE